MLKTKNIFIVFFVVLALIFGFIFYTFTNSYLNFLLTKQYEQKIKSLDDVLKFSLLEHLMMPILRILLKILGLILLS